MAKRLEAGGSYSPQNLLAIGLELQRQNDQLDILVKNQVHALVSQRELLDQADAASGMMPVAGDVSEVLRGVIDLIGDVGTVRMLANEAAELTVVALRVVSSGGERDALPPLADKIANVTLMIEQTLMAYPGLATAASIHRGRKVQLLPKRHIDAAAKS